LNEDFDKLWRHVVAKDGGIVQEYNELEHVYNLIKGCESYLEIGTAEGKSLYVLGNALNGNKITYVDLGEDHTTPIRNELIKELGKPVTEVIGDSNSWKCYDAVKNERFDAVFIDAGHDLINVLIDAMLYAPLATKYVIFHDVTMPDVNRVFEYYSRNTSVKNSYRVVNSETFGYGIIEL